MTWMTAPELSARYLVTSHRLEAFGLRGNLAFRRTDDGTLTFEDEAVARLFPRRGAEGDAALGVLGRLVLGKPSAPAKPSRRAEILRERARLMRPATRTAAAAPERRRAAG